MTWREGAAGARALAVILLGALAAGAAAASPAGGPGTVLEGTIQGTVRLSGRVRVARDVVVLPGASLEFAPGSQVAFVESESTRVEPEWFFGGTELVIRGRLRAEGTAFLFPGRAGGIVVDGGRADLEDCRIAAAEAGLVLLRGGAAAARGTLVVEGCRVGVALFPAAEPGGGGVAGGGSVVLRGNGVGAVRFPGAPPVPAGWRFEGSEEKDVIEWPGAPAPPKIQAAPRAAPSPGAMRLRDLFVDRDRTLSGDVIVDGVVRVAPGAVLTILPGSRLFFAFRDSDGDGIGESGILLQGTLRARGTAAEPILFLPEEGTGPGRWDAINFMASEGAGGEGNVLEHVVVSGAYRALHAHFSRLSGRFVRIAACWRGLQFQESEVDLEEVEVLGALSVLRCRDSTVRLRGFRAGGAVFGANFFRSAVRLEEAAVAGAWYGLRFRESRVEAQGAAVSGALVGVSVQDGAVRLSGVSSRDAGVAGFAVQDGDVTMAGCRAEGARLDALSAVRGRVVAEGGTLAGFGRHAVRLSGPAGVTLRRVRIGPAAPGVPAVLDGRSAPGLGVVTIE